MREQLEPLKRYAYLLTAAVILFVGYGYAPERSPEYAAQMAEVEPLLVALNSYEGYRDLLQQTGSDIAIEIIGLIENSSHPELVKSIIEVESNWRVDALSPRDARGLMQIRPVAGMEIEPELTPDDLFDPVLNVRIGIEIFERHMDYFLDFHDTEHWALTAYNRGRKGTFDLNLIPPSTRYSRKVLGLVT
ncbi:lytic transglycosylase domain-containing protein [bacterium]|nr:lytic transglycosylase domain-containing protein [bacterium]